mgnify:CR=1 FL=1|jgi:DNA (cytosine-5)-methyltransferase 1
MKKPTAFSLFSGCGGFDLGVMNAGFRVVGANELDVIASIVYMRNLCTNPVHIHYIKGEEDKARFEKEMKKMVKFDKKGKITSMPVAGDGLISHHPEMRGNRDFWFGDVRDLKGEDILDVLNMDPGDLDMVFGGPPCQGFSTAGKRDPDDERNQLIFEFGRLILELQPKTFVMENVPGLGTMKDRDGRLIIDKFREQIGSNFRQTEKSSGLGKTIQSIRQRTLDCFVSEAI